MPAIYVAVGKFLHRGGGRGSEWQSLPSLTPLALIVLCGGLCGAAIGGYHGLGGDRPWIVAFAAIKVPLLFGATLLLAVPSFYVLNLLSGVGDDFPEVWRGLVDYQLSVSIQLAALVPVTLFLNVTLENAQDGYRMAQGWGALIFALAAWTARRSLAYRYQGLVDRNSVHRTMRRIWFVLYTFVGIQFGWVLRPFLGHPDLPAQFFRDEIGNAYVEVAGVLAIIGRQLFERFIDG